MTYENLPPSRNGTLDDVVDLRPMADPITIRDVMDVVNGPYCFFYE